MAEFKTKKSNEKHKHYFKLKNMPIEITTMFNTNNNFLKTWYLNCARPVITAIPSVRPFCFPHIPSGTGY